jgi:hypothetical protein
VLCADAGGKTQEQQLHLEFEAAKQQSPVISREGLVVGRAADCDMVLAGDASGSSEHHARLHQCGE